MPAKFSKVGWYWHRLRAMSPGEVLLRLQKKSFQRADAKGPPNFSISLQPSDVFPKLPNRSEAPPELLDGLRSSATAILRGDWLAFGHLPLKVDDPPNWHCDYLVGKDLRSTKSAFQCDHRAQPGGADIKVIWEPSRWYQLVRLAMAAWLLDDTKARDKCIEWLYNWHKNNPPFTGLNWTSGLEVGLRLVNFTWIDAFLAAAGVPNKTLNELREEILPPHVWYAWRYKSFGSSANNHLIGELAGLILALTRWPGLSTISAPLADIAKIFEREVLLQFAPDGGNNEQALSYHLFSWEFCWQCERALEGAALSVAPEVKGRLRAAGAFYAEIKPENDTWDFGDSDNACVTPLFAHERTAGPEWWRWFNDSQTSLTLRFWWGDFRHNIPRASHERLQRTAAVQDAPANSAGAETRGSVLECGSPLPLSPSTAESFQKNQWHRFENSGYAVFRSADWFIRFDLSPLGYLSMAPHGHLDALHVSVWFRGEPVIIDPGTGAYYADKTVRNYLADWAAHNSPHLRSPPEPYPKRFGTFLWGSHHKIPTARAPSANEMIGELELPYGRAMRTVTCLPESNSIRITDMFKHAAQNGPVTTRWKLAPEFAVKSAGASDLLVSSAKCTLRLSVSAQWTSSRIYNPPDELRGKTGPTMSELGSVPVQALVAPAFRSLAVASYLTLESAGEGPFTLTISPA